MDLTPEKSAALRELRDARKFAEEEFYPGAPSEPIRLRCELAVNAFIEEVAAVLQRGGKKGEVFNLAKSLQESFEDEDTEEREKLGDYIGETMCALGLDEWMEHV